MIMKRAFPLIALVLVIVALTSQNGALAVTVFTDDFSSGSFSSWSKTSLSTGSNQSIDSRVARFIVPTPTGGNVGYSSLVKDGFVSTVNSTIIASQDMLVAKVPSGCQQGNGAIFFLYVCDSGDLGGNLGNIGVGIDGSSVWTLWVGGSINYTSSFQTIGTVPLSNIWYHVVLIVDNSAGRVTLTVDGVTVISTVQRQFTDRTHAVSLMSGLGETWWSDCIGPQSIDIDNVHLDISDMEAIPTLNPTAQPTSSGQTATTNPKHTTTPTTHPTATSTQQPSTTEPSKDSTPTASQTQSKEGERFSLWMLLPFAVAIAVFVQVVFALKRRGLGRGHVERKR